MGWEGFAFFFPALFVTVGTIGLGGLFVLTAWADRVRKSATTDHSRRPTALFLFTAVVLLDLIGLVSLWMIPTALLNYEVIGTPLSHLVWSLFLVASFVFVMISMVLAQKGFGPAKNSVQSGSRALFVIYVLGFIWFLASSHGAR
jgi:hypothetical protein